MQYDKLLQGKRVLITSTNDGVIGSACAELFTSHGATVCQTDTPDVWLNADNAYCPAFADELTDDELTEMIDKNVVELFNIAKRIVPNMRKSGGSIVLIGSDYARFGGNGVSAYAATMGAQLGFANALAMNLLPHHVRVNNLLLGYGARPGDEDLGEDPEFWYKMVPIARRITLDEIAYAALFLASDMSRAINAEGITINGGTNIIAHKQGYRFRSNRRQEAGVKP